MPDVPFTFDAGEQKPVPIGKTIIANADALHALAMDCGIAIEVNAAGRQFMPIEVVTADVWTLNDNFAEPDAARAEGDEPWSTMYAEPVKTIGWWTREQPVEDWYVEIGARRFAIQSVLVSKGDVWNVALQGAPIAWYLCTSGSRSRIFQNEFAPDVQATIDDQYK